MPQGKFTALLAAALCLFAVRLAWADTMRCGNKLIEVGESMAAVKAFCGAPASVQRGFTENSTVTRIGDRRFGVAHSSGEALPVQTWTYNRGPNKFMMSLRFVNGKLVAIKTLTERGY